MEQENLDESSLIRLKKLLQELLSILNAGGYANANNAKYVFRDIESYIRLISEWLVADGKGATSKELESMYKRLFGAHHGINQFYFWNDSYEKRVDLNKPLDDIKEELQKTFKSLGAVY